MRRSFWAALCGKKHPLLDVNPVGNTFNIQNSIPHKSQKPKAVAEINSPIEFQRGTAGVPESAKECDTVLPEGLDIGLGPGDRAFEPHYSDQNPSEIVDFRGVFLFFVYCGAEFEWLFLRQKIQFARLLAGVVIVLSGFIVINACRPIANRTWKVVPASVVISRSGFPVYG